MVTKLERQLPTPDSMEIIHLLFSEIQSKTGTEQATFRVKLMLLDDNIGRNNREEYINETERSLPFGCVFVAFL